MSNQPSFMDKAWAAQKKFDKRIQAIKGGRYARVLKMAKKPEPEEFRRTSGIVLVGVVVVGGIGFVVYLIMSFLMGLIGL